MTNDIDKFHLLFDTIFHVVMCIVLYIYTFVSMCLNDLRLRLFGGLRSCKKIECPFSNVNVVMTMACICMKVV